MRQFRRRQRPARPSLGGSRWRLSDAIDEGVRNLISRPSRLMIPVLGVGILVGASLWLDRSEVTRIERDRDAFVRDGGNVASVTTGGPEGIDAAACLALGTMPGVRSVAAIVRMPLGMRNTTSGVDVPMTLATPGIAQMAKMDDRWLGEQALAVSPETAEGNDWWPDRQVRLAPLVPLPTDNGGSGGSTGDGAGDSSRTDTSQATGQSQQSEDGDQASQPNSRGVSAMVGGAEIYTVRSVGTFSRIDDVLTSGFVAPFTPRGAVDSCVAEVTPQLRPTFLQVLETTGSPKDDEVRSGYRIADSPNWSALLSSRNTRYLPLAAGVLVGTLLAFVQLARRSEYGLYRATGLSKPSISVIRTTEQILPIVIGVAPAVAFIALTSQVNVGWTLTAGVQSASAAVATTTLLATLIHSRATVFDLVRDR